MVVKLHCNDQHVSVFTPTHILKSGQSLQCTAQGRNQPRENRLTPSQEYLLATGNMRQRSGTADLRIPIPF